MKDFVSIIRKPIESELKEFNTLFADSLSHTDGQLEMALNYIRQRAGKRMRPMLIFLFAKLFGAVNDTAQRAAIGLELLHTASLVHDDVVDEAGERRGQASVNAVYDNKIAVLVGDYILSTALLNVARTDNVEIVSYLARLGQTLSDGEILQLTSNGSEEISEATYYNVIKGKTAALFEACCAMGALSSGASQEAVEAAKKFGQTLGIIFQIRDDIFDYYDSHDIGKPTGNDMAEGKLTLPVIHALTAGGSQDMWLTAQRVKAHKASQDDIAQLVQYTKEQGGIEYAEQVMQGMRRECVAYIDKHCPQGELSDALHAYIDFVIERKL